MNKKIVDMINTTAGRLIFALISGAGYFMIMYSAIVKWSDGHQLLAWYFAPVIICGAGLVLIKLIKQAQENENEGSIIKLFWLHTAVFIIGAVMFAAAFAI